MKGRSFPFTVVVAIGILGLLTFFSITSASETIAFNLSRSSFDGILSLWRVPVFGLLPMLAIIDLFRRRPSGRYLAIIPLLISFASVAGKFADMLVLSNPARKEAAAFFLPFGIALGLLVLSLGFNKNVIDFLSEEPQLSDLGTSDLRIPISLFEEVGLD